MFYSLNPAAPKNRCPTWVFLTAASRAFAGSLEVEDGCLGLEDIICIVASLIDQVSPLFPTLQCVSDFLQSLVLGHLSYSSLQLVMKPSDDGMGGFPRVAQVFPRRVEAVA